MCKENAKDHVIHERKILFKQLYEQYNLKVRTIVQMNLHNDDVNDVVQEVFVKTWKGLSSFKEASNVMTWLYRITMNTIYDYYRKNKKNNSNIEFDETVNFDGTNAQDASDAKDLVSMALKKMSVKQRDVITLFYIMEQSVEDITKILKISNGTVKSRLHYAKGKLEQIITEFEREI